MEPVRAPYRKKQSRKDRSGPFLYWTIGLCFVVFAFGFIDALLRKSQRQIEVAEDVAPTLPVAPSTPTRRQTVWSCSDGKGYTWTQTEPCAPVVRGAVLPRMTIYEPRNSTSMTSNKALLEAADERYEREVRKARKPTVVAGSGYSSGYPSQTCASLCKELRQIQEWQREGRRNGQGLRDQTNDVYRSMNAHDCGACWE